MFQQRSFWSSRLQQPCSRGQQRKGQQPQQARAEKAGAVRTATAIDPETAPAVHKPQCPCALSPFTCLASTGDRGLVLLKCTDQRSIPHWLFRGRSIAGTQSFHSGTRSLLRVRRKPPTVAVAHQDHRIADKKMRTRKETRTSRISFSDRITRALLSPTSKAMGSGKAGPQERSQLEPFPLWPPVSLFKPNGPPNRPLTLQPLPIYASCSVFLRTPGRLWDTASSTRPHHPSLPSTAHSVRYDSSSGSWHLLARASLWKTVECPVRNCEEETSIKDILHVHSVARSGAPPHPPFSVGWQDETPYC